MKDYEVLINGFNIVDPNQSPEEIVLPEEFDTCLVIWEEGWVSVGHWETGTVALSYDPRGAFFDGVGGHFTLDDIVAWKSLEGVKAR